MTTRASSEPRAWIVETCHYDMFEREGEIWAGTIWRCFFEQCPMFMRQRIVPGAEVSRYFPSVGKFKDSLYIDICAPSIIRADAIAFAKEGIVRGPSAKEGWIVTTHHEFTPRWAERHFDAAKKAQEKRSTTEEN